MVPTVLTGPEGTGRGIHDGQARWQYQKIAAGNLIIPNIWVPNGSTKYSNLNLLPVVRRHQQQRSATLATLL